MKVTPHLIAAGIIAIAALGLAISPLLTGGGNFPIVETQQRVADARPPVVPATTATAPLAGAVIELPVGTNPFALRRTGVKRGPQIPLPPPPPLTPPAPPVLPLPEH